MTDDAHITPLVLPPRVAAGQVIDDAWGNGVVDELARLGPLVDANTTAVKLFGFTGTYTGAVTSGADIPWSSFNPNVGGWVPGSVITVPAGAAGVYGITTVVNYSGAPGATPYITINVNGLLYGTMHPGGGGVCTSVTVNLAVGSTFKVTVVPNVGGLSCTAYLHCYRIAIP
jgi:hypothetical protein